MVMQIATPAWLFNRTVSIFQAVKSLGPSNGPVENFVAYLPRVPVKIQFNVGSELPMLDGAQRAKRTGWALCAPGLGITPDMRMVFEGEQYNITAVRDTSQVRCITRIDFESIQ